MPENMKKKNIFVKSLRKIITSACKACFTFLLFLYFIFFIMAGPLAAGNVLNIAEDRHYPLKGTFLEILEDKKKNLTIEDAASSAYNEKFSINKQATINLGYTSSAYWIRFSLTNKFPEKKTFYLEVAYALLDYISLFSPEQGGYKETKYGQYILFNNREIKNRNFVYKIPMLPETCQTYYLRIETEDSFSIPMGLYTEKAFIEKEGTEHIVLGFLYGILVVMLLYNLSIYIFARDRDYLFLVLFIASFILYIMSENGLAYEYLWPSLPWWSKRAIPVGVSTVIITSSFFVRSFLNTRELTPWLDRTLLFFRFLGIIGIPVALGARYFHSIMYAVAVIALYAPVLIFTGCVSIQRGSRSARFFLTAWLFLLIGAIVYALKTFGLIPETYPAKYGVPAGAVIQMILLSIGLADKIYIMKNEVNDLNKNLEVKVRKRTEQLNAANEELAGTMKDIELINENLIKNNIELELSHKNAERDMELAINIQNKFFPGIKVDSKEWDIACRYMPASGVSGDLYEFYRYNENILGVGLFDVSGHGISAGLITLLAKTIIYNRFMEMKDKKINLVLESINESLITELKNVDNYLTGILLRFRGNKVEYVNGGHPDLLIKQGKTGNVNIVNLKDRDVRGMLLGVESLESRFNALTFEMEKDSQLLLYSDCMIESTNKEMKAYDMDNLIKAFSEAPSESAEEALEYILEDFYNFTDNPVLSDDLTLILMKKSV